MTDDRLIEEAAKAIYEAGVKRDFGFADWWEVEQAELEARAALAVFEAAHIPALHDLDDVIEELGIDITPTNDEREALATAIWSELEAFDLSMNSTFLDRLTNTLVAVVFDSGFRRSEVPEPSAKCADCGTSITRSESGEWDHVLPQRTLHVPFPALEPQGEPSSEVPEPSAEGYAAFEDWEQEMFRHQPVLSMADGSIAGCQCLDRVFVKGQEDWGTHLAAVITARLAEPQGERSDAQVLAALNARELSVRERSGSARHFNPAPDLSYYSEGNIADMRAVLRAAGVVGKGGETR